MNICGSKRLVFTPPDDQINVTRIEHQDMKAYYRPRTTPLRGRGKKWYTALSVL